MSLRMRSVMCLLIRTKHDIGVTILDFSRALLHVPAARLHAFLLKCSFRKFFQVETKNPKELDSVKDISEM